MRSLVFAILTCGCMASSALGQGYRPGGVLPGAPAAPTQGNPGWRPGGTVVSPGASSGPARAEAAPGEEALYPLRQTALPGRSTEAEGLLAVVDRLAPELGFLQNYVLNLPRVRTANELERAQIFERERQRFSQLAANDTIWLAGSLELGDYDPATSSFPVVKSEFALRKDRIYISFAPSDQMVFRAVPMPLAEARIALPRLRPDRKLSVLVEASPKAAGAYARANAGDLAATLFFEPRRIAIWQPSSGDGSAPFVLAVLHPNAMAKVAAGLEPPSVPAVPPDRLVLNQETIALLLAKNAPERMTDAVYIQMMINRWIFERRRPPFPVIENSWPVFYRPGQPPPNAVELRNLLPAFKTWVSDRIANLPTAAEAQLETNWSSVQECTAFGPAGGFDDRNSVQQQFMEGILTLDEQTQLLQMHLTEQNKPRSPDEIYLSGPLYFANPGRNLAFDNSTVERYSQTHCQGTGPGRTTNWDETIAQLPKALKPTGYPIGVLKVASWARRGRNPPGASGKDFRVSGAITATHLVTDRDGRPKVVITLEPESLSDLEQDHQTKQFKIHPIATKNDLSALSATRPIEPARPERARPNQSLPPVQGEFDILGIRLGMSIAEAEAAIRAHGKIGWTFKFAPRDKNTTTVFTTGTVHISETRSDYFILIHDPRLKNDSLLAVGRFNFEGPGQISEASLIEGLVAKYGVRKHSQVEGTVYQFAERVSGRSSAAAQPCFMQIGGLSQSLVFTDVAGRPADFSNAMHPNLRSAVRDIAGLPWVGFQNLYLNDLSKLRGCRPNVTAWIPANNGSVAGFLLWLSDLDTYAAELTKLLSGAGPGGETTRRTPRL